MSPPPCARAGQADAYEQIYRWFERPVYTLALRICGDREEAQDVLQDTMLKLIRQIANFRGEHGSPFWGWLRQIAVNEGADCSRTAFDTPSG